MANTFMKPQVLASAALAALHETTILPQLLSRDFETDLTRRGIGDTVDIRVPGKFEAREWTPGTKVAYQDVTESKVQVKMNKIHDVSVKANALENVQSIDNLNDQIIVPAMRALVDKIEAEIMTGLVAAAKDEVGTGGQDTRPYSWDNPKVLIDAGVKLRKKNAPVTDRYALIGPDMEGAWLDKLASFKEVGDLNNLALREAVLGRIQGFDVFTTNTVQAPASAPESGQPTTEVGVAFHRSAAALAVGTLWSNNNDMQAVESLDGLAIRVTRDYSQDYKEDLYSFDVLWGMNVLRPDLLMLIKGADQS